VFRSETACFVVKQGGRDSAEDRQGLTRRPRQFAPAESGHTGGAQFRTASVPRRFSAVRKDII